MKKRKIKAAKKDFSVLELPQTRKDQYFFIIKNQIGTFLLLGLFFLLCFFPIILTDYFQNIFEVGFYNKFVAGELTKEDYYASLNVLLIYGSIFKIVFTFVASIAFSGANRIYKNLLSGEGVLFKEDFKLGIKQNYLRTAMLFLIFSLILTLIRLLYMFLNNIYVVIPFYILLVLLVIPVLIIASIFSSIYECGFFSSILNATKLYLPYWWKFLLLGALPFVLIYGISQLESVPILAASIQMALAFIGLPFYILLLYSVSFSLFDKYINRERFPDFYLSGLYRVKDEKTKEKNN